MSKKPKLTKIWIEDCRNTTQNIQEDVLSLRADFDNDRHYEERISYPYDNNSLAFALHSMAHMIESDPLLSQNVIYTPGMSEKSKLTEFELSILGRLQKEKIMRWQNCTVSEVKALNRLVKKGYASAELIGGYVAWREPL